MQSVGTRQTVSARFAASVAEVVNTLIIKDSRQTKEALDLGCGLERQTVIFGRHCRPRNRPRQGFQNLWLQNMSHYLSSTEKNFSARESESDALQRLGIRETLLEAKVWMLSRSVHEMGARVCKAAQVDDHAGSYCKDLVFMQRRPGSAKRRGA